MLFKLVILLGLVVANSGFRISSSCCKSGVATYHKNRTISCAPALLPNVIYNMTSVYLKVNITDARKHFQRELTHHGLECHEIVFNEILNSTQLGTLQVWHSKDLSRDGKFDSPNSSNIVNIQKCCNHAEYYDKKNNMCMIRKDYQSFKPLIQRYKKSFTNATFRPMCKTPAVHTISSEDLIDILLKKDTFWNSKKFSSENNTQCIQNDLSVDNYTLLICNQTNLLTQADVNKNKIKTQDVVYNNNNNNNININININTTTQSGGQNVVHNNNKAATHSGNWTNVPKCINVNKTTIRVQNDGYQLNYNRTTHNSSLTPNVGLNNNHSTKLLICPHGVQTLHTFKLNFPSGNLSWVVGNYLYTIQKEDYCINKTSNNFVAQRCYTTIKGKWQSKSGANGNFGFPVAFLLVPIILTIVRSNHQ